MVQAFYVASVPAQSQTQVQQAPDEIQKIGAFLQHGDPDEALHEALSDLRSTRRDDPRILTLASVSSAQIGHMREALGYAQRALREDPGYLPALEITAQILFQGGDAGVEPYLRRILRTRPNDENANAIMADLSLRKHQCADEIRYAAKAERIIFSDSGRVLAHARCLAESGQQADAINALRRGLQADLDSIPLRFDLTSILARASRTEEAVDTLHPLVESASPETDVLVLAAKLYVAQNNFPQALTMLQRAIALHPHDQLLYLDVATLFYEANAAPQGIEILSRGIQENAGSSELYLARAILYGAVSDTNRCLSDLDRANRGDPHLDSLIVLGLLEEQAHDFAQAVALYSEAVRRYPSSSLNHLLLAESLSRKPEDVNSASKALHEARTAVQLSPHLVAARVLLSRLEFRNGEIGGSERECESALRLEPGNEEALYQLLMIKRKTASKAQVDDIVNRLKAAKAKDSPSFDQGGTVSSTRSTGSE